MTDFTPKPGMICVTRVGQVTDGPIEAIDTDVYTLSGSIGGSSRSWNAKGDYWNDLSKSDFDLVAEYKKELPYGSVMIDGEIVDLTKNTTPHGLLREVAPRAAEALEAFDGPLEAWWPNRGEWMQSAPKLWDDETVYRVSPKPIKKTVTLYGGQGSDPNAAWLFSDQILRTSDYVLTFETENGRPITNTAEIQPISDEGVK